MKQIFYGTALAVLLVFGLVFGLPGGAHGAAPEPTPFPGGILDLHCHAAGIGAGGSSNFVSKKLRKSFKFGIYLKSFQVTEDELTDEGDQLLIKRLAARLAQSKWISKAVVLALDGVVDKKGRFDWEHTELYIDNLFLATQVAKYPNLLFGASINPYRFDAIERLEEAVRVGAVLVKWIPNIQGIDPSDEKLVAFYQKMRDLRLPLLVHTGNERSFSRSNDRLGDPALLELPLRLGVTVIAAHVATSGSNKGIDNVERLARLMPKYPNLWTEISTLDQINKLRYINRVLKDPRFTGRMFYGSDMPLPTTQLVSSYYSPFKLGPREMLRISGIDNPWDRDVSLKLALGFPPEIFTAAAPIRRPE